MYCNAEFVVLHATLASFLASYRSFLRYLSREASSFMLHLASLLGSVGEYRKARWIFRVIRATLLVSALVLWSMNVWERGVKSNMQRKPGKLTPIVQVVFLNLKFYTSREVCSYSLWTWWANLLFIFSRISNNNRQSGSNNNLSINKIPKKRCKLNHHS